MDLDWPYFEEIEHHWKRGTGLTSVGGGGGNPTDLIWGDHGRIASIDSLLAEVSQL